VTLPRRTRRRIDAAVAAAIAIVVAVTAFLVWHGSDFRATADDTAPSSVAPPTPSTPGSLPSSLVQRWEITTDSEYGAVTSVFGTVVTADEHTVTGHDASTGKTIWSYSRSNVPLCGIGSGDTVTTDLDAWPGVHGIVTVYAKNGWCSQVTTLNPNTGERLFQRTSPNQTGGQLFFGSPYAGWMGHDYLELWRHDLLTTIRYGNQPNPVNSNGPHTGCTFTDAAVTDLQLATIEHCTDKPGTAQLVLNWPTPGDAPDGKSKGWDTNHSEPKATIELKSPDALIVGITPDRAAVLVSGPRPALVTYDSSGTQVSRKPVDISAAEIAATADAGITPSVTYNTRRYSLVGHHLLAMSAESVSVVAPTTATTTAGNPNDQTRSSSGAATSSAFPQMTTQQSPLLDWIAPDAVGLPTRISDAMLVPTRTGLTARAVSSGTVTRSIPVDRGSFTGRVDVTAIGRMLVEVRGGTVVGLSRP
jgi:hypothetical protein